MSSLPKRVLIVFQERPPIMDYLEKAFADRGVDVIKFYSNDNTWFDRYVINRFNKQLHNLRILPKTKNLFQNHPLAHRNYLNTKLRKVYEETQPDMVLAIRGMDIGQDAFSHMTCPKIGWWVEPETHIHEAVVEAHLFDWYFCMNETCVDALRHSGYDRTSYLQHAVDTSAFFPMPDTPKKYDLCFVGKHSNKRQQMIEAALEVTPNIVIYGPRWKEKNLANPRIASLCKGQYIAGADLNRLYNESRIVLNVTGWDGQAGQQRSGMNMRLMEVPAAGACLLSDASIELEQTLSPDKDLLVYSTIDDFKQTLRHYLAHPEACADIGRHGSQTVSAKYTYAQTVDVILHQYRQIAAGAAR